DIPGLGGGVYCATNSQTSFESCRVTGNTVVDHSVAEPNVVDPNDPNAPAEPNDPNEGPAEGDYQRVPYSGYGGGFCLRGTAETMITDCTFSQNQVGSGFGGAIDSVNSDVTISASDFTENVAMKGGALSSFEDQLMLTGSSFTGNLARASGEGGAVYLFTTNAYIADSVFTQNQAEWSGGGLYLAGATDSPDSNTLTILSNCMITQNLAGRDGGGISCNWYVEPIIRNCTISENRVSRAQSFGGGLYASYGADVRVIDSIIWNNIGPHAGAQIAVGSGDPAYQLSGKLNVTYSDIGPDYDPNVEIGPDLIEPDTLPVIREGFDVNTLPRNDDGSTDEVDMGFAINFFGDTYSSLYVNNNGNVTFNESMWEYTPWGLTTNIGRPIIAAFFGDVDTWGFDPNDPNASKAVTYGTGTVNGRSAFGVNWVDVGYFGGHYDKLNSFQLIIIDRSDRGEGDFDIEYNYERIEWETGDITGEGGFGGQSARAGFSNGSGEVGTFYEFEGSGVHGGFLDTNLETGLIHNSLNSAVPGRYIFTVVNGVPVFMLKSSPPIHVDTGCTLNGEVISVWDPYTYTWPAGSNNINADPNFVAGYYLSHFDADQDVDSPCIDLGSDLAIVLGLHTYTTRTDGVFDADQVDMGYHYGDGLSRYYLNVTVLPDPCGLIRGYVEPNSAIIYEGEENLVTLTAYPDCNLPDYCYRVKKWTGTDDDSSTDPINTVT
ncbi:MAG: nidogen-like domain-containing protein, partial [Planctomycetota bacterium]